MSNTELGGALSTFGEKFGHDGNDINSIFEYTSFKTKRPQYQNIHVYHLVNMLIIVLITKKV